MPGIERYYAAACQIDLPCPRDRQEIAGRTQHMLEMIDQAVAGYAPLGDVRLVVFPEFAHAAPIYESVDELREHLAIPVPNEHTDLYAAKAKRLGVYIQTGTFLEVDRRWPGHVFNTTVLVGPDGVLAKYRKVQPWLPLEVHASPHDLPGYDEPLFPVTDTEIGKLGVAICYDWLFPEVIRQLGLAGAEVLVRVERLHGPLGHRSSGLVDAVQSGPSRREPGLRRGGQSGLPAGELSALQLARPEHDRRLRRADPLAGRPRAGQTNRCRAD